jgi:hypothetical protein
MTDVLSPVWGLDVKRKIAPQCDGTNTAADPRHEQPVYRRLLLALRNIRASQAH